MNIRADFNWFATRLYTRFVANQKLTCNDQHLLVACQPKTGSTYLTRILGALPQFKSAVLVPGYGRREQELDELRLLSWNTSSYVAHHHVRYSEYTQLLMDRFDIKPVVLVRNIFDIVVSLRDHFREESVEGPMGFVFPYMADWPDSKIEELIVHMIVPWYFNFFLSWLECKQKIIIRYEELNKDALLTVNNINSHYALGFSAQTISEAVELANSSFTRKNRAIIGRGKDLQESSKQQIYLMASFYEDVDFTPLGISLSKP